MPKPLLVNISGMRSSGVSVACERVGISLNAMDINTVIVKLSTAKECISFSDDLVLGKYNGVDVVLFDKHFFTESAVRRSLKQPLWLMDDDASPDLSVLMTPKASDKDRHKNYLNLMLEHFGTDNHHVISTAGKNGKLYAAGNIKRLILKELKR